MNEFDLAEDKDALKDFGEAWAEEILGLKKWNEKTEKLQQFINQVNTPKILPHANANAVVKVFEKLLKDSNMNVYDETVKAIGY